MTWVHLKTPQHPTWHERAYDPGTPPQMHQLLRDEAKGCNGEFGHHYWAENHPYYTTALKGYVWLPGIAAHELPGPMRREVNVDNDGKVFLHAIVDETTVPAWMS